MEDNNKKDPSLMVDEWLKEIMAKLDLPDQSETKAGDLGADEHAIASAGLTHPDDMELEKIVQETLAENWGEHETEPETEPEPHPKKLSEETQFFQPPTQETIVTAPKEPAFEAEPSFELDLPEEEELIQEPPLKKKASKPAKTPKPKKEIAPKEPKVKEPQPPKEKKPFTMASLLGSLLKGIPSVVSTAIWLVLILAIGTTLGRIGWLCAKDLLALGKESFPVAITINEGDEVSDVAEKLKDAGLIEYPKLFTFFTELTGKCDKMLVGTIYLNEENPNDPDAAKKVYDYNALANALSYRSAARVTVDVLIPEGYNCAQIFALLEEKGVCSAAKLEEFAASGPLEGYWFLSGVPRGHKYCLEGFLFPDTYNFYLNDEAEPVIRKLLNGFKNRFSQDMVDKYAALVKRTGLELSLVDVITMASIVEKEKATDPEGYYIASVFYNRLTHSSSYPLLQSDATIKYDTDYRSKGQLITKEQINASPYNTYTQRGLPPTPIANPGLASLNAALDPESSDYFFFIYDKSYGQHRFSKTLAEHNAWAKRLGIG